MLLARTPMKPAGDVHDAPKPMKWLRCLQCNQKFPENEFKAHQRESKSPCELVRSPRDRRPPRRPRYTRAPIPTFRLRVAFLEAHEDAAAGVLFARRSETRHRPSLGSRGGSSG